MDRCHLYLPLLDTTGAAFPYAQITLLDETTGAALAAPVYTTINATSPVTFPIESAPAVVEVWTDDPVRVTVVADLGNGATLTMPGVDILPSPVNVVRSQHPVAIKGVPGNVGTAMLASGIGGVAAWQPIDAFGQHQHKGDAPGSVVVGTTDPADYLPDQTWIGPTAGSTAGSGSTPGPGDQGDTTTAIGYGAAIHGAHAIAVGRSSSAQVESVALGDSAVAAAYAVAIGAATQANATESTALGQASTTGVSGGVVVGSAKTAAGVTQLGPLLARDASGNLLVGSGTVPDTTGWTGPFLHLLANSAVAPWYFKSKDAMLGAGGGTVGAFGATGGTTTVVDGSTATGALLSLLQALDSLGLIYLTTGSTFTDTFADYTKMAAHDANLTIDTANPAYFDNRANRLTRASTDTATNFSYSVATCKDFAVVLYLNGSGSTNPVGQFTAVYTDPGAAGSYTVPLGFTTPVATSGGWYRCWAFPKRQLPAKTGSGNVTMQFTLQNNALVSSPEVGQLWLR